MLKVLLIILTLTSANALAQQHVIRDWLIEKEWEQENKIRTEKKAYKEAVRLANMCEADGSITYGMVEEKVEVKTEINNLYCGPSSGKYTVVVKAVNPAGTVESKDHKEAWSREDNATVINTHFYDLKADTTLVSVEVVAKEENFCTCLR